jgi:N-acetylglucosamine kinase-like BadF-type ATPase
VAFAGYSRTGKDEASRAIHNAVRIACGDYIKRDLAHIVAQRLPFSVWTEEGSEKQALRPVMEQWGMLAYDSILKEMLEDVRVSLASGFSVVNPRLMCATEAKHWKHSGGKIIEVVRPGVGPATEFERKQLEELRPFIDATVVNDSNIATLRSRVWELADR